MVRFDMSEFQELHTVSRWSALCPPLYVVGNAKRELVYLRRLRLRPYCPLFSSLLFSEIEKASPGLLQLLLQIPRRTDVSFKPRQRAHVDLQEHVR